LHDLEVQSRIAHRGRVVVRVDVHETGRDDKSCGVDFLSGGARDAADLCDAVTLDGHIAASSGGTGAVDDCGVADDELVGHVPRILGVVAATAQPHS
jgi:hypothetical protein